MNLNNSKNITNTKLTTEVNENVTKNFNNFQQKEIIHMRENSFKNIINTKDEKENPHDNGGNDITPLANLQCGKDKVGNGPGHQRETEKDTRPQLRPHGRCEGTGHLHVLEHRVRIAHTRTLKRHLQQFHDMWRQRNGTANSKPQGQQNMDQHRAERGQMFETVAIDGSAAILMDFVVVCFGHFIVLAIGHSRVILLTPQLLSGRLISDPMAPVR